MRDIIKENCNQRFYISQEGVTMELRVLQYFLTVAQEEGINRAADVLHITQPALSRQLSQLEEEVGVKLFHRGARKITLTNEGILLKRRAEEILALVDKTEKELVEQEQLVGCKWGGTEHLVTGCLGWSVNGTGIYYCDRPVYGCWRYQSGRTVF